MRTQQLSQKNTVTQLNKNLTHNSFSTVTFTQQFTEACTKTNLHAQTLLHTPYNTQRISYTHDSKQRAFTHQKLLHAKSFTHKCFHRQRLPQKAWRYFFGKKIFYYTGLLVQRKPFTNTKNVKAKVCYLDFSKQITADSFKWQILIFGNRSLFSTYGKKNAVV